MMPPLTVPLDVAASRRSRTETPPIDVWTTEEYYGSILDDMRNQMRVVLLVFGVICSVAVLLIFCIFYMIVTAKQKDIAIMKSCGASSQAAASIFIGFGACVGLCGSVMGLMLGTLITNNVNILE